MTFRDTTAAGGSDGAAAVQWTPMRLACGLLVVAVLGSSCMLSTTTHAKESRGEVARQVASAHSTSQTPPSSRVGTGASVQPLAALSPDAETFRRTYDPAAGIAVVTDAHAYMYGDNIDEQFPLASVAKLPIMAALLDETMQQGRALTSDESQLLTTMIENSDNDSALALWNELGGGPAVHAYVDSIGVPGMHLVDGADWGDSTASPRAIAELLFALVSGRLLDAPRTALALNLLENVEADQRWGAPVAFPDGSTVAIKDGWYPTDAGPWRLNSAAASTGSSYPTVVVVMTDDQSSFDAGTQVIEGIASRVGQAIYGSGVAATTAPASP